MSDTKDTKDIWYSLDDVETEEELGYTQEQVQKLVFDNWLDSGYRLVLPEVERWSDNY